ncbi:hypothetical protein V1477_019322, partial [Vespula maculifrons]
REREEELEGEIGKRGWANRANGQVAYLWRPYFRYMNWFPSKVRDAASFQLKITGARRACNNAFEYRKYVFVIDSLSIGRMTSSADNLYAPTDSSKLLLNVSMFDFTALSQGRGGGGGGGGGGDGDGDGGSTVRRTTSDAAFGGSTAPRAPAGGGRGGEDELGAVSAPRAAVVGGSLFLLRSTAVYEFPLKYITELCQS